MSNTLILIRLLTQSQIQGQIYSALLAKVYSENREATLDELDDCLIRDDAGRIPILKLIDASKGN